jgi:hypothetical protein
LVLPVQQEQEQEQETPPAVNDDEDVFMSEKLPRCARSYILPRRLPRNSCVGAEERWKRKSLVPQDFQMSMVQVEKWRRRLCNRRRCVRRFSIQGLGNI